LIEETRYAGLHIKCHTMLVQFYKSINLWNI